MFVFKMPVDVLKSYEPLEVIGFKYSFNQLDNGYCYSYVRNLIQPYIKLPLWTSLYNKIYIMSNWKLDNQSLIDIADVSSYLFDNFGIKRQITWCPPSTNYVTPFTINSEFYYTVTKNESLIIAPDEASIRRLETIRHRLFSTNKFKEVHKNKDSDYDTIIDSTKFSKLSV